MYKVKYYDFEMQIFKGERFETEKEAKEYAIDCITLFCYDKAVVYDENGCEIGCYRADSIIYRFKRTIDKLIVGINDNVEVLDIK